MTSPNQPKTPRDRAEYISRWLDGFKYVPVHKKHAVISELELAIKEAVEEEREVCCSIIFGLCESDNVAQRTVDAIRSRSVNKENGNE